MSLPNRLALEVLRLKPSTNLVVSTLPLYFLACKLATVADEEAKQEIEQVLGVQNKNMALTDEQRMRNRGLAFESYSRYWPTDTRDCYNKLKDKLHEMQKYSLIYINNLYVDYSDHIEADFLANSSDTFGVYLDKVGFKYPKAAVSYINRLIEAYTYKRIKDMLSYEDIDMDTRMVLVNAMYHQVQWRTPFDYRLTKRKRFYRPNSPQPVYVPMISKISEYYFLEHYEWDCKILVLPEDVEDVTVTIVMPNTRDGLPRLLDIIYQETEELRKILKTLQLMPLRVQAPMFKIKSYVDWTGFLQEIGLHKIFNETSSGLNSVLLGNSTTQNIFLNVVKQKAVLEMDEMGPFRNPRAPDPMLWKPQLVQLMQDITIENPFYFMVTIGFDYDVFNGVYYGPD